MTDAAFEALMMQAHLIVGLAPFILMALFIKLTSLISRVTPLMFEATEHSMAGAENKDVLIKTTSPPP